MKKETASYECHHCHKRYTRESAFIQHKCKQMLRLEELQTPLGQSAWQYYQKWMRLQKRRVPEIGAFMKSNYYMAFNRFAKFAKKLSLPSPDTFIKLMIDRDFLPTMWGSDQVYAIYMEHLDRAVDYAEHAEITVNTIDKLADALECDTGEIFDELNASEVIELVKQRRLSPWLLLRSPKFFTFLKETKEKNLEQFMILNTILRVKYWRERFDTRPNAVKMFDSLVKDLNLK